MTSKYSDYYDNINVYQITGVASQVKDSAIKLNIPSKVGENDIEWVADNAFSEMLALEEVVVSEGITRIGKKAFYRCLSLETITIPSSVKTIDVDAFLNCSSLKKVYFCGSIDQWTQISFLDDGWNSSVGSNPLALGAELYINNQKVESAVISEAVSTINENAFCDYAFLKSVTIPSTVRTIESYAFSGCTNIEKVYYNGTIKQWIEMSNNSNPLWGGADLYIGGKKLEKLVVPKDVVALYASDFGGCTSLKSITFEADSKIVEIGSQAFVNCVNLLSVVCLRTSKLVSIGENAFNGCKNLALITLSSKLGTIGYSAFLGCKSLTKVFYEGDSEDWSTINISSSNDPVKNATRYYYSEYSPSDEGNYWHYISGTPTIWS